MEEILQQIRELGLEFYVTVGVLLATFLLVFFATGLLRRRKANTILLAGLSGAGNTFLSEGKYKASSCSGCAGSFKIRTKLDEFLSRAAGIVFVVDALDFLANSQATAEYLYDILTRAVVVKKKIRLLVVCNKVDKVTAHSMDFTRKQLEKEIDRLRASRSSISAADISDEVALGVQGQPFTFTQCINKVTVTEASAISGKISEVEHFIREHVKP